MAKINTSLSLSEGVFKAAKAACAPKNENRDFSNLCEVALTEWMAPRGYMNGDDNPKHAQLLTKVGLALRTDPALAPQIEDIVKKSTRRRRAA